MIGVPSEFSCGSSRAKVGQFAYAVELAGKEDEAIRELRIADTAQLIADLRRRSARS